MSIGVYDDISIILGIILLYTIVLNVIITDRWNNSELSWYRLFYYRLF